MADFAPSRALIGASGFSGRESRKVIVQHETLLRRAFHCFNQLCSIRCGQCCDSQHLGFAAAEGAAGDPEAAGDAGEVIQIRAQ